MAENIGSQIENDEALVTAEAEKPVRDLAREKGVDQATKEIFDRRAEQRGDEALSALRERKESLSGLVNPELHEFKARLEEANRQLEEEFGEKIEGYTKKIVPTLISGGINEKGELVDIRINDLVVRAREGENYMPVGPLGNKLKIGAIDLARKGQRGESEDEFISYAYSNDSETKVLIDRFLELKRKAYQERKNIEDTIYNKKRLYEKAEGINSFLERIGYNKRIPEDFNPSLISSELYRSTKLEEVNKYPQKIAFVFSIFDDLKISQKQREDIGYDLDILCEEMREVASGMKYALGRYSANDDLARFVASLGESSTGKRYLKGDKDFLYTVEG